MSSTYDRVKLILEKSQVKAHTRTLASGKVVNVKGHSDKRTKKPNKFASGKTAQDIRNLMDREKRGETESADNSTGDSRNGTTVQDIKDLINKEKSKSKMHIDKRINPPQVSSPVAIGGIVKIEDPNTKKDVSGKLYAIPGFEEYKFVAIPPSGSKQKSNKAGWRVLEKTTGIEIANLSIYQQPHTEHAVLDIASKKLRNIGKEKLEAALVSLSKK